MKTILFCLILLTITFSIYGQVGLGTTDVHNSAIVELKSSDQGFLIPRMTTLQKNNIVNPAEGLMVFSINSCENGALSIFSDGSWTTTPTCPDVDFDDDGIPNNIDIDDDNDGILDILELSTSPEDLINSNSSFADQWGNGNTTTINQLSGFQYNSTPSGETSTVTYENLKGFRINQNTIQLRTFQNGENGNNLGSFTINVPAPSATSLTRSTVSSNPLVITNINNDIIFHIRTNTATGLITDINKIQAGLFDDDGGTVTLTEISTGLFEFALVKTSGSNIDFRMDILGDYVTQYEVNIEDCQSADQFRVPLTRYILSELDPDGDGIPSHRDLDSDNDGCSDALEAGSTTSTTANFNYTNTDIGANGLSNGIETSDLLSGVNVSTIDTTNAYNSSLGCP